MRPSLILLAPTLAAIAACTPTDPDLAKPCSERRTPYVKVGTGATEFLNVGDAGFLGDTDGGVLITINDAGCDSIWLALACEGLGSPAAAPIVRVTYGVTDVASGADLTGTDAGPLVQAVALTYDTLSTTDQVAGIAADFSEPFCHAATAPISQGTQGPPSSLLGTQVYLWAHVTDQLCNASADGGTDVYVTGFDTTTCTGCLLDACTSDILACGDGCMDLQSCLDARCTSLSALASPDEPLCQMYCESLASQQQQWQHVQAATALVNLAECVQAATQCAPPCFDYPFDFKQCILAQGGCPGYPYDFSQCNMVPTGACTQALNACTGDRDCQLYAACASRCTSWSECLDCTTVDGGVAGEKILEQYTRCIEETCIAPGWVAHM